MKTRKYDAKDVEVLIAEDSATQREQLRGLLEAHGYAVAAAANGREALKAMRRRAPTLVISDIVMPALDGYDLCRAIKSDETLKHIPVMLVTTLADALDVVKALECGADNFIRKPYDERYLLSRIEYLLMNLELRRNQKMRMGIEISLGGQRHFITSERQQILDLLISTYEQAVRINDDLKSRERELRHSNQVLKGLYRISEGLNAAVTQQAVAETALERAMEVPGVQAGWISLREGETGFRLLAAHNLPPALELAGAMEGECACRRKLLAGELDSVTNILECERLRKATGDTRGLRIHASVPLWLGGETLGVMNLAGPNEGLFDESELKILYGIGHGVAVALERARLNEHMETLVEARTAQLTAEIAQRRGVEEAQARLVAILEATTDLVATADPGQHVAYANASGRRMLSVGADEDLSASMVSDFFAPAEREHILTEGIPAAIRDGVWAGETVLLSSDGREIPVSQVIIAHKDAKGSVQYLSTIARDITERKEQQARIERLNRVYAVLSGINTAIVRIRSRQELFDEACHIAVGYGGFIFAWLGLLDADTHAVRPVAKAGRDEGYLEKINLTADESAPGNCELTAQALTSAMPVVCSDIAADERIKTWRDAALQRGYRSIALLPLIVDGRPVGIFVLYAPEPGVFDEQEMKLLEEIAGDISFALDHLAKEDRLHHLAYFDTVTGLPNRTLFHDRLGQRVIDARRDGSVFSVAMLDLDRFRSVNESLGQAAGDEVLREVARRLEGAVGDAGILARTGSNTFAVVSRHEGAASDTTRMREPLGSCIQARPFVVHDKELRLGAKIGIALFP
ncbi:MAG: GAF domain-containing protein, partial [Steroidobacteraceae bacterium]